MKVDVLFSICYPILLNNALDDVVCLINDDTIFTLYNCDIDKLEVAAFLECIVKEGIKLLS